MGHSVFKDTELWLDVRMSEMGEVECSQRSDDTECVITIVPRGQMFTKCSQRVSIIFLPYAFYIIFTKPFTMRFKGVCLQWFFTIFLAERFYNVFTLLSFYKFSSLTLCFPILFLFFLQCFLKGIL